jgi:hypothetical protein
VPARDGGDDFVGVGVRRYGRACRRTIRSSTAISARPSRPLAFAAAHTFLVMNGARLTASAGETEKFLLGLYAAGTFDFERLNRWLRDNVAFDAKGQ